MKTLAIILFIISAANASAANPTDTAANEKIIVDFLTPKVHLVNQPFYVWSWFNADDRNPVWKTALKSDSPAGYTLLKK